MTGKADFSEMSRPTLDDHVSHILRWLWNPIDLDTKRLADDYDSYVPAVVALVRSTAANDHAIVEYLMSIGADQMMMVPAPKQAMQAARALLGLREACGRAPDSLVSQTVSPDGLRCLWVFQRADDLCFHEQVALRHEVDENGAWSWWTEAGTGRSGLFATAEEAEQDARSSIKWLRIEGHEICP